MAIEVTDSDFQEKVENSQGLVVVDFWAPWCGPCQIVSPEVEKLSQKMSDKLTTYKINVDQNRETAAKYRIMSIPTIMWFKDGKVADSVLGAVPFEVLESKSREILS